MLLNLKIRILTDEIKYLPHRITDLTIGQSSITCPAVFRHFNLYEHNNKRILAVELTATEMLKLLAKIPKTISFCLPFDIYCQQPKTVYAISKWLLNTTIWSLESAFGYQTISVNNIA